MTIQKGSPLKFTTSVPFARMNRRACDNLMLVGMTAKARIDSRACDNFILVGIPDSTLGKVQSNMVVKCFVF